MYLIKNMALFFRSFAEINQISLAKLQTLADISRGSMYAYYNGEGNPTFSTVEHIADKLHVNPVFMVMGAFSPGSDDIYILLWQTIRNVTELPREKRQEFIKLFVLEVVKLL